MGDTLCDSGGIDRYGDGALYRGLRHGRRWGTLGSDREEGMYLLGRKSDRKYGYRGSAGLEVGKHHVFGATGNISMTLCFEPIGKEEEALDVVTGKDESLCV